MNQTDIKNLEKELWDAADELRGNSKLTAAEYKDPLLGLVLLRFAQNRYEDAKIQIDKNLPVNPRTGKKREANKDDFAAAGAILLNEKSKYDYLAALPEGEDIAQAINNAMKLIEDEYKDLEGILPKSYQEFDDKLLRDLVRVFNKDAVKKAKGDPKEFNCGKDVLFHAPTAVASDYNLAKKRLEATLQYFQNSMIYNEIYTY